MASYSGVIPRGSNRSRMERTASSGRPSTRTSCGSRSSNCTIVTVASPPAARCSAKNRSNPMTTSSAIDPIEPDRSSRNQIAAPVNGSAGGRQSGPATRSSEQPVGALAFDP